jgi:hypothetical protein
MKGSVVLALLAFSIATVSDVAVAQTFILGNPRNRKIAIPLDPSMQNGKIVVTVVGKKADDTNLELTAQGPAGMKLSGRSMTVQRAADVQGAYAGSSIPTRLFGELRGGFGQPARRAVVLDDLDPTCGCRPRSEISAILANTPNSSREILCSSFPQVESCDGLTVGGGGTPVGGPPGSASQVAGLLYAFVESNRCVRGGKPAVAIEIDLSQVESSALTGEISIKTKLVKFGGNRRALIKPESDGGIFEKQALLLAGPIGGVGDSVRLSRFEGQRRISLDVLPTPDRGGFITYRSRSYLRRPIGGYLQGGKGVFYISARGVGYPLCVDLVRRRQSLNNFGR